VSVAEELQTDQAAAPPPAVRVRGLIKSFPAGDQRIVVLKGIDLDVYLGELLLLVGESGGGKTTLLSAIAGILDINEGELDVLGVPLPTLSGDRRTRFRGQTMGFVFQQFHLLPALTTAENVAVPLLIQGLSRAEALKRARALLEQVGLGDRTEFVPSGLSGGQQQRVAIARALVSEPRLLICDEPTAALDGENGQKVMAILREVGRSPDRAVIVVTHDSRVFHYGDRIAELTDGRIVGIRDAPQTPLHPTWGAAAPGRTDSR
jgi:putative ABC transport system ATP-binding protein